MSLPNEPTDNNSSINDVVYCQKDDSLIGHEDEKLGSDIRVDVEESGDSDECMEKEGDSDEYC